MQAQTVTIIGLGRVGTSVGLALKQAPLELEIVGYDTASSRGREVKDKLEAVDKNKWSLTGAAEMADIVVIAVPAAEQESVLRDIGNHLQAHTLVVDLSGLKSSGLQWATKYFKEGHYVGARPVLRADLLADGSTGVDAARADLFQNSVFCVAPGPNVEPKAVDTAVNFGRLLGATPYFVEPMEFDSLIQAVDTIPGLLAAAMFNAAHNAIGWRDILRFAGHSFAQTVQPLRKGIDIAYLASGNREATLRWIDALQEELAEVRRAVAEDDRELLEDRLEDLDIKREIWLRERMKNDWAEDKDTPEVPGIAQQFLGGFFSKNKK